VFVADRDGSDVVQVTRNGRASWAPFLHPDGERVIFASDMGTPPGHRGRPNFDL
jgi:TolB protein